GNGTTTVPITQGAVLYYYPYIEGIVPFDGYRDKVDFSKFLITRLVHALLAETLTSTLQLLNLSQFTHICQLLTALLLLG
ncbi:4384_t:CDS:1, partial [Dentiscutata heterogama]